MAGDTRGNALAAGNTIMITQADNDTLAEKNREHLRKAVATGEYFTERDSMFYKCCESTLNAISLSGELLLVDQGSRCRIIRTVSSGSILVRYTDKRKRHWFAWIHA